MIRLNEILNSLRLAIKAGCPFQSFAEYRESLFLLVDESAASASRMCVPVVATRVILLFQSDISDEDIV